MDFMTKRKIEELNKELGNNTSALGITYFNMKKNNDFDNEVLKECEKFFFNECERIINEMEEIKYKGRSVRNCYNLPKHLKKRVEKYKFNS